MPPLVFVTRELLREPIDGDGETGDGPRSRPPAEYPFCHSFIEVLYRALQGDLRLVLGASRKLSAHALDGGPECRSQMAVPSGSFDVLTGSFLCLKVVCHFTFPP